MPKSLAEALNTAGSPPVQSESGDSAVPPPSRRGRKAVTVYLDAAAHRQLRMLALEQGRSGQDLVMEAIDDLFGKHGKARLAR